MIYCIFLRLCGIRFAFDDKTWINTEYQQSFTHEIGSDQIKHLLLLSKTDVSRDEVGILTQD